MTKDKIQEMKSQKVIYDSFWKLPILIACWDLYYYGKLNYKKYWLDTCWVTWSFWGCKFLLCWDSSSILNAITSFIIIELASIFLLLERLSLNRAIGVLIGVSGVIIAVGYQNLFELQENDFGKYLILIATISYSFQRYGKS